MYHHKYLNKTFMGACQKAATYVWYSLDGADFASTQQIYQHLKNHTMYQHATLRFAAAVRFLIKHAELQ